MKRFQDLGALNNKYGFIWIFNSSTSTKRFHLRKKYEEVNLKFINARVKCWCIFLFEKYKGIRWNSLYVKKRDDIFTSR